MYREVLLYLIFVNLPTCKKIVYSVIRDIIGLKTVVIAGQIWTSATSSLPVHKYDVISGPLL